MKKTLVALLFVTTLSANAQLVKGTKQIGGYLNVFSTKTENDSSYPFDSPKNSSQSFQLSPTLGVFLTDHIVLGGSVSFGLTKQTSSYIDGITGDENKNTYKGKSINLGPYIRFYKPLGESAALFLQGNAQVGFGKTKSEGLENDVVRKSTSFNLGIRPGFTFFLSEKLGIEGTFGALTYSWTKEAEDREGSDETEGITNGFNLSLNPNSFTLGIQYYFTR